MAGEKARIKNILLSMMADVDHFERSIPSLHKDISNLQAKLVEQHQVTRGMQQRLDVVAGMVHSLEAGEMRGEEAERTLREMLQELDRRGD
jgi:hypothetical protein